MGQKYIVASLFENNQEKYNSSNSTMLVNATRDLLSQALSFEDWQSVINECSNGDLLSAIPKAQKEIANKQRIFNALKDQSSLDQLNKAIRAKDFISTFYTHKNSPEKAFELCRAIGAKARTR